MISELNSLNLIRSDKERYIRIAISQSDLNTDLSKDARTERSDNGQLRAMFSEHFNQHEI